MRENPQCVRWYREQPRVPPRPTAPQMLEIHTKLGSTPGSTNTLNVFKLKWLPRGVLRAPAGLSYLRERAAWLWNRCTTSAERRPKIRPTPSQASVRLSLVYRPGWVQPHPHCSLSQLITEDYFPLYLTRICCKPNPLRGEEGTRL